jgi:6-phosphogluconolactonase
MPLGASEGDPEIIVLPDAARGATEGARRLAEHLATAAALRGVAHFATTGGSTAAPMYRAFLSPGIRDRMPWTALHVWWGDDRFVPPGDPDSNVTQFDEILVAGDPVAGLPGARLAPDRIHPVPVAATLAAGGGVDAAAARYAAEIGAALPRVGGLPAFDAMVLGVGPDGHCLSVFPQCEAFDADRRQFAVAIAAPTHVGPHLSRVTLHPALVGAARAVVVLAFGGGKAEVLARVLAPEGDVRDLPARLARRAGATWVLDRDAAALLPGRG